MNEKQPLTNFNGYEICTHRIYLVQYSQQILMSMFEMSHFNYVLVLITINIFNYCQSYYSIFHFPVLTMLLFYIL